MPLSRARQRSCASCPSVGCPYFTSQCNLHPATPPHPPSSGRCQVYWHRAPTQHPPLLKKKSALLTRPMFNLKGEGLQGKIPACRLGVGNFHGVWSFKGCYQGEGSSQKVVAQGIHCPFNHKALLADSVPSLPQVNLAADVQYRMLLPRSLLGHHLWSASLQYIIFCEVWTYSCRGLIQTVDLFWASFLC